MKIKVALQGMDERSEERMLMIFKMNFKGQCEHTDINDADTVILDMDGKNIGKEWSAFRINNPEIPAIIMATNYVELIDAIYISKPAKLSELLAALKCSSKKEISSNLNTSHNTHNVAKALQNRYQKTTRKHSKTSDSFELFYNPNNFLQGKVLQAINEGNKIQKSMFLKCWKDSWIVTLPDSDSLLKNVNDKKIKTLGLVPLGNKEQQLSYSKHLFSDNEIKLMSKTPTEKIRLIPIYQFVWDLTAKTARGRVPEGTSLDKLYILLHWPNLPRLSSIPNAARISAFWVNQPQSINNVISKLSIPQEDILTYFSAASAIGILKEGNRKEDALITPDIQISDKKKQSIFSALIRKISKNIVRSKDSQLDEINIKEAS